MRRIFATDKKPAGKRKEKMTICDPLATMRDSNLNHHWYPPPSIYLIFFIFLKCLVCLSYTPTTFQTAVSCKKRHFLCFLWPTAVWNVVGRLDKQVKIVLSFLLMVIRFISLLFFLWCSKSWAELLTRLPGQPGNFPFEKYSGYIVKDAKHGRVLFYNFVEAESADPLSRPWPYGSMEVCIMLDILSTLFYFFFPVYKKRLEPETSLEDWNASWATCLLAWTFCLIFL